MHSGKAFQGPARRYQFLRLLLGVVITGVVLLGVPSNPATTFGASRAASSKTDGQPSAASSQRSTPAVGDTGTSSPEEQRIRVHVEVVNVPVTVLSKQGTPVLGLSAKDFRVYEDGKRQTIRYFGIEPPLPLRIGLIIDTSNSARMQLKFEKDAASQFVFEMLRGRNSANKIFLQTFDSTSSIVQDFTNDPDVLNEKIRNLKAGGGKAFNDAIYYACKQKMLKAGDPEHTRRVLIVISDGNDVQSRHTFDEVISMAHRAETMIYTIGNVAYGFSNPGDKVLSKLAEETGGGAFFPLRKTYGTDYLTGYLSHGQMGDQNQGLGAQTGIFAAERLVHLADALQSISEELKNQYTIGYTPTNNVLDGTYRTIRVVTLRKGLRIRAKPGYFAIPR